MEIYSEFIETLNTNIYIQNALYNTRRSDNIM